MEFMFRYLTSIRRESQSNACCTSASDYLDERVLEGVEALSDHELAADIRLWCPPPFPPLRQSPPVELIMSFWLGLLHDPS